jgi:UDP-N-acetylmuramyl pentapeptide synthase
MVQNDVLTNNVNRLAGSVSELEQVEQELAEIADTDNIDRLVFVVSETKRINEKMKVRSRNKYNAVVFLPSLISDFVEPN